jgi:hypothetical protein
MIENTVAATDSWFQHRVFFHFVEAAIFAVRTQCQIAEDSAGGVAFHIKSQSIEIDFFSGVERSGNGNKHAGHTAAQIVWRTGFRHGRRSFGPESTP